MNDISSKSMQPTLRGSIVELRPLREDHALALVDAAADGRLWDMKLTVVPDAATIDAYIARALAGRAAGTVMPFVIVRRDRDATDASTGRIVGSTRF